jgi:enoyl-CoA hydratase
MSEETMTDEPVVLTEVRGKVMIMTLNRPQAMNAVNQDVAQALAAAVDEMDANPDVSCGVLTGNGRGFCAGMDLKAFVQGSFPSIPGRGFGGITEQIPKKPMIAAVEGFALAGGLELALACDLIVSSEGAKFGIPEASVGLFAGAGGLLRLPRVLPYAVAMRMALTAKPITAEEAMGHGMVAEITPKGEALDKAIELAEQIAMNAPLALMASKDMIREMQGRTEEELWAYQGERWYKEVFQSEDGREGATAFAEKRAPNWQGK